MKGRISMYVRQNSWARIIAGAGLALTLALSGCGASGGSQSGGSTAGSGDAQSPTSQGQSAERTDAWVMTKSIESTKQEFPKPDGTKASEDFKYERTFTIDEHGNVTAESDVSSSDNASSGPFSQTTETTSTFDADGYVQSQNVKTTASNGAGDSSAAFSDEYSKTYAYEKDGANRVTKSTSTSSNGLEDSVTTYEYDAGGKLTKKTVSQTFNSTGGQQQSVVTTTYGADGIAESMTESHGTPDAGGKEIKTTYSYERDDKGRVTKKTGTGDDGTAREWIYTWDENNNIATEKYTLKAENATVEIDNKYEWAHVDKPSKNTLDRYKEVCMIGQ